MLSTSIRRAGLAAIALAGIAGQALALALADETETQELAPIVVTARRMEENLQEVPISISVYSQDDLSKLNIVSAADLGTYVPSLSTNSQFGPEKASFAMRGFVQDSQTQPSVGVYFADVVSPRGAGLTPSGNGVGPGALFDLENVQVLKGPQGTLFGRNTTGGDVLLVPRKPTDEFGGYLEASGGDYNLGRLQAAVNLPMSDVLKVRAAVDYMTREGYLDNVSGIGPHHLGNVDYIATRLSAVLALTPALENYAIFSFSESDDTGTVGRLAGCNSTSFFYAFCTNQQTIQGSGHYWNVENTEPLPIERQSTWQVIDTTAWDAGKNLTVKNIASYGQFHETARYSLEGEDYSLPNGGPLALTLIRTNNLPGGHLTTQSTYTEELQFQGELFNDRFTWQAGGYFENSDPLGFSSQFTPVLINCQNAYETAAAGNVQCPASTGTMSVPFYETWYRNRGLYGQSTYHFSEQWALTAGIRETWDSVTNRYDGTSIAFPTSATSVTTCSNGVRITNPDGSAVVIPSYADHAHCRLEFSTSSHKPTWLIDLDYKPTQDLMLYAKWARGYRAGGANGENIDFETWQPETVDTYEGGAKTTYHAPAVSGYFNFAGFYNNFRNQQLSATAYPNPRPGNPFLGGLVEANAGKSRIWEFEVDSSTIVLKQLTLNVGYTYLNTRVVSITNPAVPVAALPFFTSIVPSTQAGQVLPLTPKNRVTASATYTLPLSDAVGKISFGPTYVHTDKELFATSVPPQFGYSPSEDLVDLDASWSGIMGRPFDVNFFMTNVTNRGYPLFTSTSYNIFGLETQYINEPRMWGVRVKYRFGNGI